MSPARRKTPLQLTIRYLFALGLLGLLAVLNYYMFRAEIQEGEATAVIQNLGSRQRLLFQHCVVLAEEFAQTTDSQKRERLRNHLLQLVAELEAVHYRMIQFDSPRETPKADSDKQASEALSKVEHIYFDAPWLLDTEVRNYIAQILALANSDAEDLAADNPHLGYVREVALSDRVTGALDAVVAAYQTQSEAKTTRLRQIAYSSFVGTYIVLAFTGWFVFRPMAKRVQQEMGAMEDLNETLEQRVSERTALAERRAQELEISEQALRNQTRILWSILESMGDGVMVADSESDFQLMNRAARQLLNVGTDSQPDVRSENWTHDFGVRIFRPDQTTPYPHEELPLIRAMRGDTVTRAELYLQRDVEPQELWLSVTARPVVDDDGGVHGGVAVWRDFTERKHAERELRDSETLYHSLVENLPMCVFRKDREGRFVFANMRFCELLTQSPAAVIGKTDDDFYPPALAKKYQEDDERVMSEGGVFEDVEEHRFPNVRPLFMEVRKSVVHDSEGGVIGLQCIFWDVTARVRAEQEREEMQRKILQSERLAAIGQMVAGVAHESRNALQKIEACTQLLRWRLNGSADGEAGELINDIQQAENRLLRLFEDLRGFASPLRLECRRCDVSEVVRKAWENVASLTNGRSATLTEQKKAWSLQTYADPFQLEQVFRNLFENSLAACPSNAAVRVEYSEAQDDGRTALGITIRDNGPGLSPEAEARIFEPFFTTKTQGTGLGTAIVRRIVEAHHGRVELARNCEEGVEFQILLPTEPRDDS